MPTLVLPPRYTADTQLLWKAAIDAGWDIERLSSWRAPESLKGRDVVLYGEPLFAAVVARELGLVLLEPPLGWLAGLSKRYQRRDVQFTTLDKARRITQPTFIKPADDKSFRAAVYPSGAALPVPGILPESLPVVVSEPVTWEVEHRCFVLNKQVVASSPYVRKGHLAEAEDGTWPAPADEVAECLNLASDLLSDTTVELPPAVVLDVGRIAGRGWAVIEANAAWGSGIYGCDPAAVLKVVARACVPRDHVTHEDRVWVVDRSFNKV